MTGSRVVRTAVVVVAVVAATFSAPPVQAEDWDSEGFLYGWFYGVDGTVAAGDAVSGFPGPFVRVVEASVDDISNFKDFSMAVHFEAKTSKAILLGDVQYLNLGAERDFEMPSGFTRGELDFQHWTFEAGGGYRVSEQFDLLGVGRLYHLSTGSTLGSDTISERSRSWMDVFVGGRYTVSSGKWRSSVRADIGTGGSDFAWFGNAMIGYRVSERMTLGLGYRILSVDYETGENANYFRYDVVQDGLGLALGLDF